MFDHSQELYDAIYDAAGKDYRAEARAVVGRIGELRGSNAATLLDVACGTGRHLEHFAEAAQCVGLDVDPKLLAIARRRCPGTRVVQADMLDFDLGETFDAVTCLFSSIGYSRTIPALRRAVRCMARHLASGGVLMIEPSFRPELWREGRVNVIVTETEAGKVVRMMRAGRAGDVAVLDAHYLLGGDLGISHVTERHELGLFRLEDYVEAFEESGLATMTEEDGLTGRGLIVGVRP